MSVHNDPPLTITHLRKMKAEGQKIAMLTAYDATTAALEETAGVDVILVGDSLGMVIQGQESTLPVTMDEMIYHARAVNRGRSRALLLVDMPFMSYNDPDQALANAGRLMQEGGAQMVKIEGGHIQVETVRKLSAHGVPVCAHIGLVPQSVHKLGGYKVQGRDHQAAQQMLDDALALEAAGADLMVLECVPAVLAREIASNLSIPVIGIGAGVDVDGQVLVVNDMLGMNLRRPPSFVKDYLAASASVAEALKAYVDEVKAAAFPGPEHAFS